VPGAIGAEEDTSLGRRGPEPVGVVYCAVFCRGARYEPNREEQAETKHYHARASSFS
jgi:hypothetical protein